MAVYICEACGRDTKNRSRICRECNRSLKRHATEEDRQLDEHPGHPDIDREEAVGLDVLRRMNELTES